MNEQRDNGGVRGNMEAIREHEAAIVAALGVIVVITLIGLLVLAGKLRGLRRRYMAVVNGGAAANMEDVLLGVRADIGRLQEAEAAHRLAIDELAEYARLLQGRVGIVRYNAFAEGGSDLSFSLAIVNEERSGVVVSGIRNRDNTHVYAKPLEKGKSPYTLSPEETDAITRALKRV